MALADERRGSLGTAFLDRSSVVALNGSSYHCTLISSACGSTVQQAHQEEEQGNTSILSPSHSHANDRSVMHGIGRCPGKGYFCAYTYMHDVFEGPWIKSLIMSLSIIGV